MEPKERSLEKRKSLEELLIWFTALGKLCAHVQSCPEYKQLGPEERCPGAGYVRWGPGYVYVHVDRGLLAFMEGEFLYPPSRGEGRKELRVLPPDEVCRICPKYSRPKVLST